MSEKIKNKVFVSGCFDILHPGHIKFLEDASNYGDLYVGVGSDKTIIELKNRAPTYSQEERKYMLEKINCVKKVIVNSGSGHLDFEEDLKQLNPDYFIVNEDGDKPQKKELCLDLGIKYIVLKRLPHKDFPARSTTDTKKVDNIPYRLDLAGGWLDQPFVSSICSGSVITISIEPNFEIMTRSGLSSSTHNTAKLLWGNNLPYNKDKEFLAKVLFSVENPPGKKEISGSQDAIGIVYPGLNKLKYCGDFWPENIESILDEQILDLLENNLYLVSLWPRTDDYEVYRNANLQDKEAITNLSNSSFDFWQAIKNKDLKQIGKAMIDSFNSQLGLFPSMSNPEIEKIINIYKDKVFGYKLSGAGGGGYLVLLSEVPIEEGIKIKIRRE
ncbi:MAG: adenylyltransferase/cytidyltransferase family protein [Nanoarchaeota archaeon]